jgi:NAD(P)-dependent dehydrogenase (short-subunit alcohol dehydrogenase family)
MALENQVVLVTGCSSGIGRALVREVKASGHRPFASARRPETLADLTAEEIETVRLDVCDPPSIVSAVDEIVARAGRLDVVINNAGVCTFGPITEMPMERLQSLFQANVLGMVAVTQAVFPRMAQRRSGRIINVGSIAGLMAMPFVTGYCATKSAVHMLSEGLRLECKPFGIEVVEAQPGAVQSNISASGLHDIEPYQSSNSRYAQFYEGIRKAVELTQEDAMPVEDFARQLLAQVFATPPPRIVRLGTGARYLEKVANMEADRRDALLSPNYGLDLTLS